MVKNLPANAGDIRDTCLIPASAEKPKRCRFNPWVGKMGSIPGWGRSPGGGQGNPLQYSCLKNPTDRGTWRAMVHRVAKSHRGLKWLSSRSSNVIYHID